jgi:peptidylprolyl isomerase
MIEAAGVQSEVSLAGGLAAFAAATAMLMAPGPAAGEAAPARTMAEVLAASTPTDWRPLEPKDTLYLQLASGRVVLELAPKFAPEHVANLKTLVRQKYFDGLAILRAQDNFVVQWGDPDGKRSLGAARATLPPEFTVPIRAGLPFTPLPDRDGFAPEAGFSGGFPAARDPRLGEAWLAHCYAMVGAGRGNEPDSGNGTELYVVIGHAPRQLDRNIALVGRVVQGMELLATLPRGTGPLGFYEQPSQHVPIATVRLAADLPEAERTRLEVLRTDTATFAALIEARRNRRDDWYKVPAGYIDLCNVPLPVRAGK